jgi:predicted PurR-regulated permease PerM
MQLKNDNNPSFVLFAAIIGLAVIAGFLILTELIWNPVLIFISAVFLLYPFRQESVFIKRLILLAAFLFIFWIINGLGNSLIPFALSFLIAYLLDPLVTHLAKKKIPRWVTSLSMMIGFVGVVTLIAIFVFPGAYLQLDEAIARMKSLVSSVTSYFNSEQFYGLLTSLGFREDMIRNAIQQEFIPKLEYYLSKILENLLHLMTDISGIATQLLNTILIPVLTFYLLKDFNKLKALIKSILEKKDKKLLNDLYRINGILRIYIGWQVTAAGIVALTASIAYTIFGIPFPIVLGIICGFLNPIPYLGIFASMIICIITVFVVNPPNMWQNIIVIISVISFLHFVNTYFLEPNIAGKRVGLHPVLLIASLFVFGALFGFVGLLVAVPTTATLMLFFNDWREGITNL